MTKEKGGLVIQSLVFNAQWTDTVTVGMRRRRRKKKRNKTKQKTKQKIGKRKKRKKRKEHLQKSVGEIVEIFQYLDGSRCCFCLFKMCSNVKSSN